MAVTQQDTSGDYLLTDLDHSLTDLDHSAVDLAVVDQAIDGCGDCTPDGGVLQFASGFEADTRTESVYIRGKDRSSAVQHNDWDAIASLLGWPERANAFFEGGAMAVGPDPLDANNKVLHLHNTEIVNNRARSQWTIKQVTGWTDPGGPNRFGEQFYRFRVYIPEEIVTFYSTDERAEWYMIWESHSWESEDTRHGIYLHKHKDADQWHFRAMQQRPAGGTVIWENTAQQHIAVPFGQWFTMEILFKYHQTDGEFYVALVTTSGGRQLLGRLRGQTQFDTKLRDQMIFKMYHHANYITRSKAAGGDGTHQYYDDLEIWSSYPPGYLPES